MIKSTLYAQYVKERLDGDILENDRGFIVYKLSGEECFIMEMYTQSSLRDFGYGRDLVNDLEKIAKEAGCKVISGNIHLFDKGASNTLIASLRTGFEVARAEANIILITKKIGGL